jgi:hypothetical protein
MKTTKRPYFIVTSLSFIFQSQKYFFAFIFTSNFYGGVISPNHKRNEGRAPVWGSDFTTNVATLQEDSAEIAPTLNAKFWALMVTGDWLVVRSQVSRTARAQKLKPARSGPFRILNLHQKNLAGDQQNVNVYRWAAALSGRQCAPWPR